MTSELVLLHPLPLDGDMWQPLLSMVQPVVAHTPTLYGLGTSLEEAANRVLEMVGGNRLIVVGNSIGGSCAIEMAAAAPNRVEQLVLVGAKAGHRPEPEFRDWALAVLETDGVTALWDQVWEPLFSSETSQSTTDQARAKALALPPDQLANGIGMFHGRLDRSALIDGWSKPLTVVTGSDDRTPGVTVSRALARQAARGVLHVVPDCGHYVPIERPEALAAIVNRVISAAD